MTLCVLCVLAAMFPGCGGTDPEAPPPLRPLLVFGAAGRGLGQFHYPRAIDVDLERGYLYIADRSGRIQRFGLDGQPQHYWNMPDWDMGLATGLTVGPDGRVFIADTHYFRVLVFDSEGNEMMRFGEFGLEPGQFVYTTDVAIAPDGRIYVAETGGNDRIQVFDADGDYLFHFGSFGSDVGQFNRPQSLQFSPDGSELFITDACNHRVVVTTPEGEVLRIFGEPGRGRGQLGYPYGLLVLPDGSLLVCEYHNNRIQKFTPEGDSRGLWGRMGFREGELQYPWAVAGDDQYVYVLDSGNNRVQKIRTP